MKKRYYFSKGERGKFYNKDAEFNLPVYLEPNVRLFIEKLAKGKNTDVNSIVNTIIKDNMQQSNTLIV